MMPSRLPIILSLVLAIACATPARAINWEGHDDWLYDDTLFKEFTDLVPAPLERPLPTCAERDAARKANVYEQAPLPGVNCIAEPAE
jgi:hypothetical protein